MEVVVLVEYFEGDGLELPGDHAELVEHALVQHGEACGVDWPAPRRDRGEDEDVHKDHFEDLVGENNASTRGGRHHYDRAWRRHRTFSRCKWR